MLHRSPPLRFRFRPLLTLKPSLTKAIEEKKARKVENEVENNEENEEVSHKVVINMSKKRVTSIVESKFKKRKKQ